MKVFRSLSEIKDIEHTVVALGNFDGIHLGHQALINKAAEIAHKKGLKSAVFTFSNHPKNVLAEKTVVKNIIYEDEKIDLLDKLGIDYMFSLDFDETMMRISPDDFVDEILVKSFMTDTAICGFNFTFGFKAAGNAQLLGQLGRERGFDVVVIDSVKVGTEVVSSTLIRQKIARGDVESAAVLLGRVYSIRGKVIPGNRIGRTIGFPTCNITIDDTMVSPPNGVYVTYCYVNGKKYNSVTNVGNKPTIGNYKKNIETNILDFDEDIYGQDIKVEFLKMTRREQKFSGLEELRRQLHDDALYARNYHERITKARGKIAL